MSSKSRQVIYGGQIIGAKIRAEGAREAAQKAVREADRAAADLWSIQMEAYGGPAQPSPPWADLRSERNWLAFTVVLRDHNQVDLVVATSAKWVLRAKPASF
jgi:hypothetical protein